MMIAGVDAGIRFVKICLVEDEKIAAVRCFEMNGNFKQRYREELKEAVASARDCGAFSGKLGRVIATGYGAAMVPRTYSRVEEGSCLAIVAGRGEYKVRTVIDAGGLFIKIHSINGNGLSSGMVNNDKCAAGSGRLLEIAADSLKLTLDSVASIDLSSAVPFQITSSCSVFAESELISRIGDGIPANDILAGVIRSLAAKTASLLENSRAKDPVAITGGLSSIGYFVESLKKISGRDIIILHAEHQMASAFGAALIGGELNRRWPFRIGERHTARRAIK